MLTVCVETLPTFVWLQCFLGRLIYWSGLKGSRPSCCSGSPNLGPSSNAPGVGSEPRDSLAGNQMVCRVIPSLPAEHQQVKTLPTFKVSQKPTGIVYGFRATSREILLGWVGGRGVSGCKNWY